MDITAIKQIIFRLVIIMNFFYVISCVQSDYLFSPDNKIPGNADPGAGIMPKYSPPSDHTESKPTPPEGVVPTQGDPAYRWHKPGYLTPYTINVSATGPQDSPACVICHGNNLEGGEDYEYKGKGPPSCYTCHNRKWTDTPKNSPFFIDITSDHNVNIGENMHRPGYKNPYEGLPGYYGKPGYGLCAVCHGMDLTGGESIGSRKPPSCYTCHGKYWTGDSSTMPTFNPGASHTNPQLLRGRNHSEGYKKPYSANCTACHTPSLEGGSGPPSCYTCHADEWIWSK